MIKTADPASKILMFKIKDSPPLILAAYEFHLDDLFFIPIPSRQKKGIYQFRLV